MVIIHAKVVYKEVIFGEHNTTLTLEKVLHVSL